MTQDSSTTAADVGAQGPYHSLRVSRVVQETHDAKSFVVEVPEALRETFAYKAGQFLTFRAEVGGQKLVRCYSLASSPDADREHKVTVKRIDEGRVSNWFNDQVGVDDALEVMRPAGVFVLQPRESEIVLFGGGSGITPVISILKSALQTTQRRIRLLYANRDEASIIFRAELDALVAAHPGRLEVTHRLDDRDGFIDAAAASAFVGGATSGDFYVCGPGPFMDVVEAALEGLSVPSDQIFIERFVSLADGEGNAAPVEAADGDAAPAIIKIKLDGKTHEVPYQAGETVLQAARRAGLEPPFACEEGYCSCCMAKVAAGQVRMHMNDALDDHQVSEGWVLTCQGVPTSDDIEVEYPD